MLNKYTPNKARCKKENARIKELFKVKEKQMDMVLITVIVFFYARYLVRSMEPTHYKHPTKLVLTVKEYEYYARNGENIDAFKPCVSILGILFKTKVEKQYV